MNQPPARDYGEENLEPPNRVKPAFPNVVHFASLAGRGDEVWIENEGQIYRLRRTRQGKLILTK